MPINVEKMALNTSTITITDGEDEARIEYSPASVTEEFISQVLAFQSQDPDKILAAFKGLNRGIVEIVKSWEIYATIEDEKDKNPFPLDGDRLHALPVRVRMAIAIGIVGDMRPESFAPQVGHIQK